MYRRWWVTYFFPSIKWYFYFIVPNSLISPMSFSMLINAVGNTVILHGAILSVWRNKRNICDPLRAWHLFQYDRLPTIHDSAQTSWFLFISEWTYPGPSFLIRVLTFVWKKSRLSLRLCMAPRFLIDVKKECYTWFILGFRKNPNDRPRCLYTVYRIRYYIFHLGWAHVL